MPVAICSTNSARVALPKTYHQLAVLRGTGCSSTGATTPPRPIRSSSHRAVVRSGFTAAASRRPRQRRQLTTADPELAVTDSVFVLEEAAWRRSRRARAVLVIGAAVTGTHEQPRLGKPAHRAPEVRAVHREDLELLTADMTHPAGDLRRRAVPRDPERVLVDR